MTSPGIVRSQDDQVIFWAGVNSPLPIKLYHANYLLIIESRPRPDALRARHDALPVRPDALPVRQAL